MRTIEACAHQSSVLTSHYDRAVADGQFASQQVSPSAFGRHSSDDSNRSSFLQGFCYFFTQEGADVSIDYACRAGHDKMHAGGAAQLMFGHDHLYAAVESDFTGRVVGNPKAASAGFRHWLGAEWNC